MVGFVEGRLDLEKGLLVVIVSESQELHDAAAALERDGRLLDDIASSAYSRQSQHGFHERLALAGQVGDADLQDILVALVH
jgi:hypothetical protein